MPRRPGTRRDSYPRSRTLALSERAGAETDEREPRSGTITRISPQKKDPDRVSIFLDGEFAFGLHVDLVVEYQLAPNQHLTAERSSELLRHDEQRQATAAALQFLAYRPRAEREIEQRLRQRGFSVEAISATLDRLRDWRYVDDQDFAHRWVENRLEHRPRSTRMLGYELRQKGIDPATIDEVIDDLDVDETADAYRIAAKKWRSVANLEPRVRQRRMHGFLARRGYGPDVIREVVSRLEAADVDAGDAFADDA